jgi:hypothetical protein
MNEPYAVTGDVYVLPSSEAAPGYGVLPVNAFLIADDAPVLVDTGEAHRRPRRSRHPVPGEVEAQQAQEAEKMRNLKKTLEVRSRR